MQCDVMHPFAHRPEHAEVCRPPIHVCYVHPAVWPGLASERGPRRLRQEVHNRAVELRRLLDIRRVRRVPNHHLPAQFEFKIPGCFQTTFLNQS